MPISRKSRKPPNVLPSLPDNCGPSPAGSQETEALDLTDTTAGMLKMLQCIIGEDVGLVWKPGVDSLPVKMDPSQIDQILVNLCVDARDAIAGAG